MKRTFAPESAEADFAFFQPRIHSPGSGARAPPPSTTRRDLARESAQADFVPL
jgi:hypothetical protein